jgi:hypothetical protein
MSGLLVFEVLSLIFLANNFVYGHRGQPAHLGTSGLATVVLTVHQECAVIFGIDVTWQDTNIIEVSVYCNSILGFLAMLGGSRLREICSWPSDMQVIVALGTVHEVRQARWGAQWMGLEPELDQTSERLCK